MGNKLAKVKLDSESVAKLVSAMSLVRVNFLTSIGYEYDEGASIVSFRDPHSQVTGNAQRSTRQPPWYVDNNSRYQDTLTCPKEIFRSLVHR